MGWFGNGIGNTILSRPGLGQTWKPLQILNLYRLLLALILSVLFFSGMGPNFLGSHQPWLFGWLSGAYVLFALATVITIRRQRPGFREQTTLQVLMDIAVITLLMHASGGVTTGMGMLLVVNVAGGSLLLPGRHAFLFAAMASLAILAEQFYADLFRIFSTTAYTQSGILGAMLFAGAFLADGLSRRARASEALAAQRGVDLASLERLNEHIIQHMQSGIIVVDPELRIRLMNNAAWYLLGLPASVEGQRLGQVSAQLDVQLRRWLLDHEYQPVSFRVAPTAAELMPRFTALGSGGGSGNLVFLEDMARTSQQAQQLKLASLGRLTASIAHEVRNPLGAISHAAQLLGETPDLQAGDQRLIEIIGAHTRRVNEIVESILQLSRREASHPEVLDLKSWLAAFSEEFSLQHALGPGHLFLSIRPPETRVLIDATQFRQILTNLCENSLRYGRPPDGHYQLVLQGGITRETKGPYLDIIDNGPGIDPEVAFQIFEPFFTTDRTGGTGLGLYIARELAEANRARLDYIPVPTGGCCFRILFADPRIQTL
ncbi:sensor histidine kinase [Thioalbus denitrificans]|uniref:histidine kinase n=1 Tax=Thioalbus denitrificans TaxID=547122 RepID=A0A369C777_9GAMM|nr:HAMP domain-containing sensor histidine kinase [Thioalbus denitrificans]RCX29872.1 two-component system sensor histidine kinase PilS (NtrC family) [Thioalbus denitrificans]